MSVTANLTTNVETITATIVVEDETIIAEINTAARGPAGGGTGSIDSTTTSNGTANLDLLNVDTVTATVSGTLTADHIHGNLAGNVYSHIRAGETLEKGDPVYVSSSHGSGSTLIPIVSKADASNAAKMPAIGIMDAGVTIHNNGHMVIVGTITELDTDGLTVNAELYVAAGGGMTATPPTARAQPVARVERVNANNGAVIVKVNGLSASDATASTLVRRDASGNAAFGALNTSSLTVTGGTTFGEESLVQFDAVEYYYGTGAAAAHRIALGAGTTGAELFGAADAAVARTTLGLSLPIAVASGGTGTTNGSITGTGALTLAAGGSNQDITITPTGTGKIVASKKIDLNSITHTGSDAVLLVGSGTVESLPSGLCFSSNANAPFFNLAGFSATSTIFGGGVSGNSHRSIRILASGQIMLGSGSAAADAGMARTSSGLIEINNGTAGTLRDLSLRNLTASGTTASSSTTTGALVVSGGVGIAGNINAGGSIAATGTVRTGGYTFATLPTPTQGMRTFITDGAALPVYMANAAGGSTVVTPVFYNGTNWINA